MAPPLGAELLLIVPPSIMQVPAFFIAPPPTLHILEVIVAPLPKVNVPPDSTRMISIEVPSFVYPLKVRNSAVSYEPSETVNMLDQNSKSSTILFSATVDVSPFIVTWAP